MKNDNTEMNRTVIWTDYSGLDENDIMEALEELNSERERRDGNE